MGLAAGASPFELLLLLVLTHFLCDFGLQSDRMACEKCPGKGVTLDWGWWLFSHAAIHGFIVATVTGVAWLGLAELAIHCLIDVAKCRKLTTLVFDQAVHLAVKLVWAAVAVACTGGPAWLH